MFYNIGLWDDSDYNVKNVVTSVKYFISLAPRAVFATLYFASK
jgi:hypothetical protein